jgi:hypothetical protein
LPTAGAATSARCGTSIAVAPASSRNAQVASIDGDASRCTRQIVHSRWPVVSMTTRTCGAAIADAFSRAAQTCAWLS